MSSARAFAAVTLLVALTARANAGLLEGIRDPQDGRFDLSEWLLDRKGVLPVPLVITEPAIGYGAGVMGLFFRESMRERGEKAKEGGRLTPPDIYGLGGIATENGTRAAAAGGMVTSEDGRLRWRGAVVRTDVHLDFFGIGGRDRPLAYNLDGWASVQHAMVRLGEGDNWLVGRWNFYDLGATFGDGEDGSRFGGIDRSSRSSGLGVSLEHDSRDNIFTPSRGTKGSVDLTFYEPAIGSDTRFRTWRAFAFHYWEAAKNVVVAARADTRGSAGTTPFYLLPFIDMRGVPVMRLQDERTAVLEGEVRWNLDARWALVGFAGAGRAWGTRTSFSEGTDTFTRGAGFRYLLARRLGLYAGVDWAWSTQDHGWYLQVGSAWR